MANPKYDVGKTVYSGLKVAVEVILAGLIVYFTDNNYYIGLVPVFELIRNWWKHR